MTNKQVNKFNEELQKIDLPEPLFYKKRVFSINELKELANGTTFKVLSDPVGPQFGNRKLLFCECTNCGCRKHVGLTYLKSKTAKCDSCAFNEMSKVADSAGLELISLIEKDNHRNLYRFKSCGHLKNIRRDAVVSGNFKCEYCYDNEISALISTSNYSLECNLEDFTYKSSPYKCKSCGYTENKSFISIKNNSSCFNCIKLRIQDHLVSNSIELVHSNNSVYGDYKLVCGHTQKIQKYKVLSGAYKCRQCYKNELLTSANNCELTLSFDNKKGEHYYCKLKCGCSQYVKVDQLRRGRVYCQTHDKTRMSSPSSVYLLEIESRDFIFLKLGFSLDLDKRIEGYKLTDGSKINKLIEIKTSNGFIANSLENKLHKQFSSSNLDSNLMLNYMTSGYTECYPFTLKAELLTELHKLEVKGE